MVVRSDASPPAGVVPVALSEVLDDEPALSAELVELCAWIADYYEAPPGEVIRAALPAGSGVAARGVVALTAAGRAALDGEGAAMQPRQRALLARIAALGARGLPAGGLTAAVKRQLDELRAQGMVEDVEQRATARTRLRRERVVQLAVDAGAACAAVARAPRRLAVVERLASGEAVAVASGVLASELGGARATGALRALQARGLVRVEQLERYRRVVSAPSVLEPALAANAAQQRSIEAIGAAAVGRTFETFLLHGVTGSGKTEVYLRVIATALAAGRTALVLVPEISLTPQLAARFRARFGDLVAILHSGLSETARLGEWSRLRRGDARIAVGARSAVFAPLAGLGVIVVDEEHDGSFKQDEGVRYHARDRCACWARPRRAWRARRTPSAARTESSC
ncbi:MAG: DEAD/DEAH box helicase [Deltaproteobacteria bacterium]|nr:MAG: DEAD/DEAH box helicase [Deltaproteobacteria bacterium]